MTATEDRTLPPDAFVPPDAEALETGRSRFTAGLDALRKSAAHPARIAGGYSDGGPVPQPALFATVETVYGSLVARDRAGRVVTPLTARQPGPASRRLARASSDLAGVDEALYEAAWRDSTRLRLELDRTLADLARERTHRQTAEMQRDAAQTELDEVRKRVAELVLTLRALGGAIHHANQHAAEASESAGSGEEGGE